MPYATLKEVRHEVDGIPVTFLRKNVKHMGLVVRKTGEVRLTAPVGMSLVRIVKFIDSRIGWIRGVLARNATSIDGRTPTRFVSSEVHRLFGVPYRLEVFESAVPGLRVRDETLILSVPADWDFERRAALVDAWYRAEFEKILPSVAAEWEEKTGLSANSWEIRKMKSRWGDCRMSDRRIRLSLELAKHSREAIGYVACHELGHLVVADHGPRFKAFMDRHFPNWREVRRGLNGRA